MIGGSRLSAAKASRLALRVLGSFFIAPFSYFQRLGSSDGTKTAQIGFVPGFAKLNYLPSDQSVSAILPPEIGFDIGFVLAVNHLFSYIYKRQHPQKEFFFRFFLRSARSASSPL